MEASDLPVFRSDLPPGIEPSLDYNNPSSTDHLLREPHPIFAGHLNQLAWSLVTLASYIKYSGFTFTDTSTSTSFSYVTTTETRYTGTATYALSGTCIPKIATLCWFRHIDCQFFYTKYMIHFCYYKCYILKKYIGISFQCICLILSGFACGIVLRCILLRLNAGFIFIFVCWRVITGAAYYNVKSIYMKLATANKPIAIIGYVNNAPYGYTPYRWILKVTSEHDAKIFPWE